MHPITSQAQDTTTTTLPDISLDGIRAIVAHLQAERPEARDRIGRAVNVLLTSEIRETAELGVYLIQSCQDSGTYYRATTFSCACPDRQRTGKECKHSWALTVLSAASAESRLERWQRAFSERRAERQGGAA